MTNVRAYGGRPYRVAVIHGGPGAVGEAAPVARELGAHVGVLEPLQTATSVNGQVEELRAVLEQHAGLPVTLIGHSWGAWLACLTAAQYPALVEKLILVGSGPFEERYVAQIGETRMSRLTPEEREEFHALLPRLNDPETADKARYLSHLGELTGKTDAYDPLPEEPEEGLELGPQGDLFQRVWSEAAEMRRSGALLEQVRRLRCPVLSIHGDWDPHPAAGVEEPLRCALERFRFVLLTRCGHTPWRERHARDEFYAILKQELVYLKAGS